MFPDGYDKDRMSHILEVVEGTKSNVGFEFLEKPEFRFLKMIY